MSDGAFQAALVVCGLCKGARWVCVAHPTEPSHPGHIHCEDAGTEPCVCNAGPDRLGWPATCRACATEEEFMAEHDEDPEAILAGLDFDLSFDGMPHPIEPVVDFSGLSDPEILDRLSDVNDALADSLELHHKNPTSEKTRDLHSQRAALLIEAAKRGLR